MSDLSPAVKQSGRLASPSLTIAHSCNKEAVCNWSPVKLLRKHDATTLRTGPRSNKCSTVLAYRYTIAHCRLQRLGLLQTTVINVSGSGKTTLLNVLTGTISATCGHVTLNGQPLGEITKIGCRASKLQYDASVSFSETQRSCYFIS